MSPRRISRRAEHPYRLNLYEARSRSADLDTCWHVGSVCLKLVDVLRHIGIPRHLDVSSLGGLTLDP